MTPGANDAQGGMVRFAPLVGCLRALRSRFARAIGSKEPRICAKPPQPPAPAP